MKNDRKHLALGLAAAVITVLLGELPIGWVDYPAVEGDITGMTGMMLGSAKLSMLQLFLGALFGGVFIPMHYFGFEAAARIVKAGGNPRSAKVIHAGALATAFLGGIVHVICVALMYICRLVCTPGMTAIPQPVMEFMLWLVMPVSVVFMPVYYAMCIALLLCVARGRTALPRWAAVFNPLTGFLLFNILPEFLPASPMINALSMANMGMGSVITFGGLLAVTQGRGKE